MSIKSLRILCDIELPEATIRAWDGSGGPFIDGDGNMYRPAQFTEDALQSIQAAINGEAYTLALSLISVTQSAADEIWEYDEQTSVQGSPFIVKLQILDEDEQPDGDPIIVFTGDIDNLDVADEATNEGIRSVVNVEATNRFTLRTVTNGAVLSDVDQRARSELLNPSAPDDEFCKRVPLMRDQTIKWPNW
jgi:3-polyprenyl-4-hydroxybenzoate decarboxylase